jgi:hypothetical protein
MNSRSIADGAIPELKESDLFFFDLHPMMMETCWVYLIALLFSLLKIISSFLGW